MKTQAPNTVKSGPKTTGHQRNVIESFVSSGIAVIGASGVDHVSVSEVTRSAGASRPTFYSYFGNVAGLLAEIWLARGNSFLERLLDPDFRLEVASAPEKSEMRALLEIFTVSRRIPELSEIVVPHVDSWWKSIVENDEYKALKCSWVIANRIGMWLTEPIEPKALAASIVEKVIAQLGETPSGLAADPDFAQLPHIDDPVLAGTTVEGQLLDAAVRVISSSGVAAATMSRVARNAQVTTGTIYPRFITNNELLLKSYEVESTAVTEQNFSLIAPSGFAPDQFGAVVMAGLLPPRTTWRNYRFEMHLEARYNRELEKHLRNALNETNKRVILGLGQLPIGKGERESIAFLVHTIGIGMAVLANNGVPVAQMDHRVITREMVGILAQA